MSLKRRPTREDERIGIRRSPWQNRCNRLNGSVTVVSEMFRPLTMERVAEGVRNRTTLSIRVYWWSFSEHLRLAESIRLAQQELGVEGVRSYLMHRHSAPR